MILINKTQSNYTLPDGCLFPINSRREVSELVFKEWQKNVRFVRAVENGLIVVLQTAKKKEGVNESTSKINK